MNTNVIKSNVSVYNIVSHHLKPKNNPNQIDKKRFPVSFLFFLCFFFLLIFLCLLFPFLIILFSFLLVCLWFGAWVVFFFFFFHLHSGMTSMTEMACATSPSSAFVATEFGVSSSSVRLRYQTVGPLYVNQPGWATLPHSYYALDYCSPK